MMRAIRTPTFSRSMPAFAGKRGMSSAAFGKPPVRVAVTGASGQIGYALLFRIASGAMLGPEQPVQLQLLELPQAMKALQGVVMELHDCAFPLLHSIVATDDPKKAFEGADVALLVGAKPRTKGMERNDLLRDNAAIFSVQGKALNEVANRNVKVLVVGNPANTNALIAASNAPNINPRNFSAMTRLMSESLVQDHNRGLAQLALHLNTNVSKIEKFCIWGNHSSTQYPDISHALIDGKPARQLLEEKWVRETFIPTVQKRGAAIIEARGASSAASAASAAIDHMRDWIRGTNGQWVSMAVWSEGLYGESKGTYFSYPVICKNGDYQIVKGLTIDAFSRARLDETNKELLSEKEAVLNMLGTAHGAK